MKLAHSILWIVLLGTSVRAQTTTQTLAHWTFESNPVPTSITGSSIGPIAPEIGSGELRGWHTSASTAWSTTVAGNGSGRSLNSNRWAVGDYYEFQVPAPGTGRLVIEWHQTRSSTGPAQFALQYSTDGSTFQDATTYTITEDGWSAGSPQPKPQSIFVYAFPADDPANDEDIITFRLVALSAPGATGGTSRIDNVKITRITSYFVTVAGQEVEVQRWGAGPKGVIFFSHSGDLAADLRRHDSLVEDLAGSEYSVFAWTYPAVEPFNRVSATLTAWGNNALPLQDRLLFPGVASSVLAQLRALTGIQDFCLVGNSLGAGVLMSDYDTLVQDPHCRMVLVSPTEAFIPLTLPPVLANTLMVSDAGNPREPWLRRAEDREFCARNSNGPFPANDRAPGHIIIRNPSTIEYAFRLVGFAFQPPGIVNLIAPQALDTVWGNSVAPIEWFASLGNTTVRIDLFQAGQFLTTLAESVPNYACLHLWAVPDWLVDGTEYAVRITDLSDPAQSAGLETLFEIRTISLGDALGAPQLSWTQGGAAPWFGQATFTPDGVAAAQSGSISHNEVTWIETTLSGPGTLTFDWRVSSELDYDFLIFSFPGTQREISGETSWSTETFEIPEGEVVVRWAYEKDFLFTEGEDAGWVANVNFTPTGATVDDPVPSVTSFSPRAGAPGATVTITGLRLGVVESVRFGGVEASFASLSDTEITATVPAGAVTGPITVSAPDGEAASLESFLVASLPTVEFAVPTPSSLEDFSAMSGASSAAQSVTISAAGLRGPLQVAAPAGFEVSRDGVNFGPSVEIAAPPRGDSAANYGGLWADGSNGGSGFSPWGIYEMAGRGQAEAYIGNPAASGVQGMRSQAFALSATPLNSEANVWVWRGLPNPLAVGESFSFDWGINWDSDGGSKGFAIASGSVAMLYVIQYGFPGSIYFLHDGGSVDTGLSFGQQPMRWSFRQVDATTLNVTATPRTGGANVAFSTNVTVPGAVSSFWWFADQVQPDVRRISYYDNLSIAPSGPGGGALEAVTVHVRLAAGVGVGPVEGQMQLASDGQVLALVSLTGTVTGAGGAYEDWAASYGLDPQSDGAPGADPDNDGHSNWLEFAFGTSPVAADGALIRSRLSGEGVTFEFLRREAGVIYHIFHTPDLAAAFAPASGIEVIVSSDRAGIPEGWQRVTFTVSAQGAGFYRISASPE